MDPVELPAETITAEVIKKCASPITSDHDDKYGVPSLEELGKILFLQVHVDGSDTNQNCHKF